MNKVLCEYEFEGFVFKKNNNNKKNITLHEIQFTNVEVSVSLVIPYFTLSLKFNTVKWLQITHAMKKF